MRLAEKEIRCNNVRGELPEFGAIFMSNSDTKKECLSRQLLGLPSSHAHFVKHVKAGMILFLFEFQRRQLHGVFRASSDGALNIVPLAFKSSGKQFPAQVKFVTIWHCKPLPETEFRSAVIDNYFSTNKFNFGLSEKQVRNLLSLFSPRKLKDDPYDRHFTQTKFEKQIGFAVNKTGNAVDDGSSLTVDDEADDDDNTNVNFRSSSSRCSDDHVNDYISEIHAGMHANSSVDHGLQVERCFGLLPSNRQFGNPLSRLGRSVDDVQLTSNEMGNKLDVGTDSCSVGVNDYPGHAFTTVRSIPNHVSNVFSFGQENKWNERNAFQPHVSTDYPDFFKSNPPVYSNNYVLEEHSLINDRLRQSSMMHGFVTPQNSNISHSISHQNAVVMNSLPYNPDVPALNYMPSTPPGFSMSMPGFAAGNGIIPQLEKQSPNLNVDVSDAVPLSFPDLDIRYSETMYSVFEKKRESVFSRLSLPPDLNEKGVGHLESDIDSSVDEIMAMSHQSNFDWVKANKFKKQIRRQDDIKDLKKNRQVTLKSRLSNNKLAKISKEIDRYYFISDEEKVIQKAEQVPSLDFKRRSEVRKFRADSNSGACNVSVENNGVSDGQRKRRKLIRPNFSLNDSSDDVTVSSKDERSNKSEIFDLPNVDIERNINNEQNLHIGHEEKNVDVDKLLDYEKEENLESVACSFRNAAEEKEEESQNPNKTSCSALDESFLELQTEKLTTTADGRTDYNGGSNKSVTMSGDRKGSNSGEHNFESKNLSDELGNDAAENNNLLESVAGNPFIETVSHGNMQESSQGICKGNVEQFAATAIEDCNMSIEHNVGNGNHIFSSSCEVTTSPTQFCSCNQNLSSCEELVDVSSSSGGKDREEQSLEFIPV